jgi:hypothetical protein
LQAAFARLLEVGLMAIPNVAVIEIEEARAIGREMSLGGSSTLDRPTPLLVGGDYTISRGAEGKRDVQLELTCQASGGQRRTVRPPALPLSAAARFIVNDLPREVLPRSDGAAIPLEEQSRWLIARAGVFSQVGAWEQAMPLLEAAVLLSPNDLSLRLKLLAGYGEFLRSRGLWLSGRPEAAVRAGVPKMIDAHLARLGHLEYLIRNQRLNGLQAVAAFRGQWRFYLWPAYSTGNKPHDASLSFRELFQPVTEAEERFVLEVYPRALQFPIGQPRENPEFSAIFYDDNRRGEDLHTLWLDALIIWLVSERATQRDLTPHDLEFLFRLLTEVVPDRWGPSQNLVRFLEKPHWLRNPFLAHAPDRITDDDWAAFLRRLAASKHCAAGLYGRYGLLHRKWQARFAPANPRGPAEELLIEVETWLKDYEAIGNGASTVTSRLRDDFHTSVQQMQQQLGYQLKKQREVAGPSPRRNTPLSGTDGATNKAPPLLSAFAKLRFEDITMRGLKCSGFDGLVACGEEGDVAWQNNLVAVLHKNGTRRELVVPGTVSNEVYWDGRRIWLATNVGKIFVLSFDGKVLAEIGQDQGLPPADRFMVLHVLAPGKVCAAASFGEHCRAWCAIVELVGQGDAKVNVFHRATRVDQSRESRNDAERPFDPVAFRDYDPGNGASRVLLLIRNLGTPLTINPVTLEVSASGDPRRPVFPGCNVCYANRRGEFLGIQAADARIVHLARPGTTLDDGKTARPLSIDVPTRGWQLLHERTRLLGAGGRSGSEEDTGLEVEGVRLIEYCGSLYVPGRTGAVWFRIDPESFRAEGLDPGPDHPLGNSWYSVSNCYGLVGGWKGFGRPPPPPRTFRVIVPERGALTGAEPEPTTPHAGQVKDH